ncbi:MAG: hypothetical protein PHD61_06015 [Bacteroidales bacterium]|nr:hypothetical protein [Lentimicrobiaceae bacterium]MDD5694842.1 hypothetical protein [Bacteroidales bacterium]
MARLVKFIKAGWLLIAILSITLIFSGGCASTKYSPEKVRFTTKPSVSSKNKKICRNSSRPMAKQTYPLEKNYIIRGSRTTSPLW